MVDLAVKEMAPPLSPSVPSTRTGFRRGRTAASLHGLAYLVAGVTYVLCAKAHLEISALFPVMAVGGAAAFTLWAWACVLSVRALQCGEDWRFPAVVLYVSMVECAALLIAIWVFGPGWSSLWKFYPGLQSVRGVLVASALPILFSFSVIAVPLAYVFARWRLRRTESRADADGDVPWTFIRRKRFILRRGMAFVLVLGLIAMPFLLTFFWITTTQEGERWGRPGDRGYMLYRLQEPDQKRKDWRHGAVAAMPTFVNDGVDRVCGLTGIEFCDFASDYLVFMGHISKERLCAYVNDASDPEMQALALYGLQTRHPQDALRAAEDVLYRTPKAAAGVKNQALMLLARRGDSEQIGALLAWVAASANLTQIYILLRALPPHAAEANEGQVRRLWLKLLQSPAGNGPRYAAHALENIGSHKFLAFALPHCLRSPNPFARRLGVQHSVYKLSKGGALNRTLIEIYASLLKDADLTVRRCATLLLAREYKISVPATMRGAGINTRSTDGYMIRRIRNRAPESAEERLERIQIEKRVRKDLSAAQPDTRNP